MPTRIGVNGFGRRGSHCAPGGTSRVAVDDGRGGTWVKVLAWYDNEIGYVDRMIELAEKVGASP
jgi:hypothetical protein